MTATMSEFRLALRLALRELGGGFSGFRVFALALTLGVGAVAAIGSLAAAFERGLDEQKRMLLGGDVEITSINGPLDAGLVGKLAAEGAVSHVVEAQLMARAVDQSAQSVVMLKGVDAAYPLEGHVALVGGGAFRTALAAGRDAEGPIFGAVADPLLFDRLSAKPGAVIAVGRARFRLNGVIDDEPDRASAGFLLGPRLLITNDAATATGLLATSALVNEHYRLIAPKPKIAVFLAAQKPALQGKGLRIRTAAEAARGLERLLRNLTIFFTMIALSALAIGGVGAANAVSAYLARKTPTIATLKCLGASGGLVMRIYLLQILSVGALAALIGLALGAAAPFLVAKLAARALPFSAHAALFLRPLAEAAAFGLAATLAFAWLPLARARRASAAELFRSIVAPTARPAIADIVATAAFSAAFLGLAVLFAADRRLALTLAGAGVGVYVAMRLFVLGLILLARRFWAPRRGAPRAAAANLTRRGSPASAVAVSLGLGLTLLATVSITDANLARNLNRALPTKAPGLFFSDIPYEQAEGFDAAAEHYAAGGSFERYYMLRAGIVAIKGTPIAETPGARRSPWARDNDWGVTILKTLTPEQGTLVEGVMWKPDYQGPPLLALADWQAKIFGLKPGDSMSLSIAGRVVTATIACTFKQNWDRAGLNFVAAFAPGTLEAARPTSVASLKAATVPNEDAAARTLAAKFPSVALIRTREIVAQVSRILQSAALVIRVLSSATLAAGALVLFGAVAAAFDRKLKDAMILKTVGASRARILAAEALEYGLLGLIPAGAAVGLGAAASWWIVQKNMDIDWYAPLALVAPLILGTACATLLLGLGAAAVVLSRRPWPVLRAD